mmetsp:Transcript_119741/g.374424  ORF Transcript_119741/g.374424 Transcript_119741/m.374424 type:complete len:106 (-) Transcript_119741:54-371(-)
MRLLDQGPPGPAAATGGPAAAAEASELGMVMKMDPKVGWLPHSLVNYVARHFVKLLFNNVCSIAGNFDRSPYPERVAADSLGFYGLLRQALERLRRGEPPRSPAG